MREHLPHATVVVDHFHIVQLANQTLAEIRRRTTSELRGRRARQIDSKHGLRRRLQRNREDLSADKLADTWNRLIEQTWVTFQH